MRIVPEIWNVPESIKERFGETAGRQRAMYAEGHLLLVLHTPPRASDSEIEARLFWRDSEGTWVSNQSGSGPQALKRHLADYNEMALELENVLQAAYCADDYFRALSAVSPLHRAARNLHSTLQQAREMVKEDKSIIVARDAAADVERTLELLHSDAKNGLEYTIAQKTEQQSQRSYEMSVAAHRLNLLAAVFFPITAISSVFGMNLTNGLDVLCNSSLFWAILGTGFSSGFLLTKLVASKASRADETRPHKTAAASRSSSKDKSSKKPPRNSKLRGAAFNT